MSPAQAFSASALEAIRAEVLSLLPAWAPPLPSGEGIPFCLGCIAHSAGT